LDRFHELDRAGLMMYGQMTAGSWIYIGTQGILQGSTRRLRRRRRNISAGSWRKTGCDRRHGRYGRGAAAGGDDEWRGVSGDDVDPERIKRRVKTGYCDVMVNFAGMKRCGF